MDRKEFAKFAMALKTYYSKEERLLPNDQAMELWFGQLKDIPFKVAEAALNKWVATNKWSPSIADIRETATNISLGELPDWGEGWKAVQLAIRRYGYYSPKEALASLDELTRACVERLGFRELCMSEDVTADRANFRMVYTQLAERKRQEVQLPARLQELIEGLRGESIPGDSGFFRIGGHE